MIRYSLICDHAHEFEGWFRDSADFTRQAERALLVCPVCGSQTVEKRLMAPAVVGGRKAVAAEPETAVAEVAAKTTEEAMQPSAHSSAHSSAMLAALSPEQAKVMEFARRFRQEVEKNADYVGRRFADEARKIHYGEAEPRGIYGETTAEDAASLLEEGVDVLPLPILPEEQN